MRLVPLPQMILLVWFPIWALLSRHLVAGTNAFIAAAFILGCVTFGFEARHALRFTRIFYNRHLTRRCRHVVKSR